MCKEVEKVLEENQADNVMSCTVVMDGEETTSEDFVAILVKENGDTGIFYNTDALTLGMSMKMIASAFCNAMAELPEEDREAIRGILGGNVGEHVKR